MAHRPRRLLAAAPLALALAACGSDGTPRAGLSPSGAPSGTTAPTGSPGATPSGPGATGGTNPGATGTASPGVPGSSGAVTSPGATASPGSRPTAAATSLPPDKFAVELTMKHRCVAPGGKQTAIVRSVANANAIIDTLYSDKKDGQLHGGFNPAGKTDAEGVWVYTWTVRPTAPSGTAFTKVAVGKGDRNGSDTAIWVVTTESC